MRSVRQSDVPKNDHAFWQEQEIHVLKRTLAQVLWHQQIEEDLERVVLALSFPGTDAVLTIAAFFRDLSDWRRTTDLELTRNR